MNGNEPAAVNDGPANHREEGTTHSVDARTDGGRWIDSTWRGYPSRRLSGAHLHVVCMADIPAILDGGAV